jgi:hypothetical protein
VPIHDLICRKCGEIENDQLVAFSNSGSYGKCVTCGGERTWMPSRVNTDIWGSPQFIESLDRTFESKSDLKKELKRCGFEPAGDKVRGARNEDRYKGSSFAFRGQRGRGSPRAAS